MSANGVELIAKRYAVGPWERFKFEVVATGVYVIRSLQNGKLLCSPNSSTPLTPTCTSSGDMTARFVYQSIFSGFGHFYLKSQQTGRWVGIAGNGRLYPSSTVIGDAATFAQLSYISPWSSLI
jgi:hypothetical protein